MGHHLLVAFSKWIYMVCRYEENILAIWASGACPVMRGPNSFDRHGAQRYF